MKNSFFLIPVSCLLALFGPSAANGPVYKTQVESSSVTTNAPEELTTQTVYGFLDFTTTIANTVMVFSPQSQKAAEIKPTPTIKVEQTKPPSSVVTSSSVAVKVSSNSDSSIQTPSVVTSVKVSPSKTKQEASHSGKKEKDEKSKVHLQAKSLHVHPHPASKVSEAKKKSSVKNNDVEIPHVETSLENNLELELDLSKAPSEKLSETYKIIEVASTAKSRHEPTGLVTKLGGTIVKDGLTTVHETSVIGTHIGGKYAQILKSSSHIVHKPVATPVPKVVRPTKAVVEPTVLEDSLPLEALFTAPVGQNLVRHSRRPVVSPPFKNRLQRTKPPPTAEPLVSEPPTEKPSPKKHSKHSGSRPAFKLSHNRFSKTVSSSSEVPTVSVFPESTRRYHRQRSATSTVTNNNIESGGRRFKPKPTAVQVEPSTSLYKFKLSRPQGRWQYKTTPKPRVPIRRQDGQEENQAIQSTPSLPEIEVSEEQQAENVEVTATPTPTLPIQTIKVEISTPANFSNVYYEIATIRSPYTFQVGTVKNTRYITLTSTLEKLLVEPTSTSSEPLTENILTSSPSFDNERTIVTLPVIAIAAGETLPLETMTDTFSTSEILLKTHLLPVVRDSNTTTLTLVQTYEVTKVVSATKTLPPTELFQFIPSKTLNEFNTRLDEAGSELHLELEFGDNDNDEEQRSIAVLPDYPNATIEETQPSTTTTSPPPPIQEQLSPEKLQQLAFLRLLNPNQPPIVTSTPILSVQTIFETHVIPVFNGLSTVHSTISRPVKTITNTQYATTTVPLPSLPLPFLPTQQIQPMITSSPVVTQTVVTATQSKVLKLTFGAKTAYTTLYSTTVMPTLLTTYLTTQLAVQPTAGLNAPFPSPFFPAFNPFQFVG